MTKKLSDKIIKMIREYVATRGQGQAEFQEQDFIQAYEEATPEQQEQYVREMKAYSEALKQGLVKTGQNIRGL